MNTVNFSCAGMGPEQGKAVRAKVKVLLHLQAACGVYGHVTILPVREPRGDACEAKQEMILKKGV